MVHASERGPPNATPSHPRLALLAEGDLGVLGPERSEQGPQVTVAHTLGQVEEEELAGLLGWGRRHPSHMVPRGTMVIGLEGMKGL